MVVSEYSSIFKPHLFFRTVTPMILFQLHSLKCYFYANEFQIFSLVQTSLTNFRLTYPTACPTIPLGFLADNSNLTYLKLKRLPEMCSIHNVLHLSDCQLPISIAQIKTFELPLILLPDTVYLWWILLALTSKYTENLTTFGKTPIPPTATQVQVRTISHLDCNNGLLTWIFVLTRRCSWVSQTWSASFVSISVIAKLVFKGLKDYSLILTTKAI